MSRTFEAQFGRWCCYVAGLALLLVAAPLFFKHCRNPLELAGGLALAGLTCALLMLTGTLIFRMETALRAKPLPVRRRIVEFAGYAAGIAVLLGGFAFLPQLPLERAGMTMGLLIVLSASMAAICLGVCITLCLALHRAP